MESLNLPRWFVVIRQLKIPEQETLRCHKLAFVTENRLLEIGTEWSFEQVVQKLVEGHSFSSPFVSDCADKGSG